MVVLVLLTSLLVINKNLSTTDLSSILRSTTPRRLLFLRQSKIQRKNPIKVILQWTQRYAKTLKSTSSSDTCRHRDNNYSCILTSDRHYSQIADGIMYHIHAGDMVDFPQVRNPRQYYLGYTKEAPVIAGSFINKIQKRLPQLGDVGTFFNLTSLYYSGSDIPTPYFSYKSKPPQAGSTWLPDRRSVRRKHKLLFWIVSNCKATSNRQGYMLELQKHIEVDIYGGCVHRHACRDDKKMYKNHTCAKVDVRDYKFYFAAENSLCKEYFTEKLKRPLMYGNVPVILSSDGIDRVAPPGSYIDAQQFESAAALARYLLYLHHNHTAYLEYFLWKRHYKLQSVPIDVYTAFCGLCTYLHEADIHRHVVKARFNFTQWLHLGSTCNMSGQNSVEINNRIWKSIRNNINA